MVVSRIRSVLIGAFSVLLLLLGLPSLLPSAEAAVAVVTPVAVNSNCNGVIPTPGSENTLKKLIGGTLQPGGTAIYEISYPLTAADVGKTFTVLDCPVIGGDVHNAQAYTFDFVPNNANFDVEFTLDIPAGTPLGTSYCNYAKTTGPPSASQGSNRKAGPACFTVGGNLRIEKQATGTPAHTLLAGASFSVSCPTPAPTVPISDPPVVVSGLVSGGSAVVAAYNNGTSAWEASGTANPGSIGISGPSGTSCTVTETAAPPGYLLPSTTSHTYTIPVGTASQIVRWNNDAAVPVPHLDKSATPADGSTVTPGTDITYSLAYYNTGNVDVTNANITDTVPAHTTLKAGTISAGGSYDAGTGIITWSNLTVTKNTTANSPAGTVSFTVTVNAGTAAGTSIDNQGHLAAASITTVNSNTTHHLVSLISTLKSSSPVSGTSQNPAAVVPTDSITYTITVTNPGATAITAAVTDTIPAHTTYVSSSPDVGPPSPAGLLSWSLPVAANSNASVSFVVTVDAGTADATVIENVASVNGADTNHTFHQVKVPVFTGSKSAVPAAGSSPAQATGVDPSSTITYTIHVQNDGHAAGTAHITDSIPAGTTYVSSNPNVGPPVGGVLTWDIPLAAGASADPTFTVSVNSGDANGTIIPNTASIAGTNTNTTYHVVKFPAFSFNKSASPAGGSTAANAPAVAPGATITYTVHVQNDGLKFGAVHVDDAVPSGTTYKAGSADHAGTFDANTKTVSWDVVLTPGESVDLSFAVTVDANAPEGSDIANVAVVNRVDTNAVHHKVVRPFVPAPALSLDKKALDATYASAGDVLHYTYTLTNTGNVTLSSPYAVTDDLIASVSCAAGPPSLAPGASFDCSGSYTVTQADVDAGSVVNHATARATFNGNPVTSNPDSAQVSVAANPKLALVKNAEEASYSAAGDQLHYTYTLTNTGNVTLSAPYTVNDDRAPSVDCPATPATLAPGAAVECTATYDVTQLDVNAGSVLNHATATAMYGGTAVLSNQDQVEVPAIQDPLLTLHKSVNKKSASYGDTLTYTVSATNTGNIDLPSVVVSDAIPDGTTYVAGSAEPASIASFDSGTNTVSWAVGDLAVGASVDGLTFKVTVDEPNFDPTVGLPPLTIDNVATATTDVLPDPVLSNHVKTTVIEVLGIHEVRPPKGQLPFTGPAVPIPVSTALAVFMIAAGTWLTASRKRRRT